MLNMRSALACLAVGLLAACSSLPTIVPDLQRREAPAVQLEGVRGPLSPAESKAVLERLARGGKETNIFERHLALEESISRQPTEDGQCRAAVAGRAEHLPGHVGGHPGRHRPHQH